MSLCLYFTTLQVKYTWGYMHDESKGSITVPKRRPETWNEMKDERLFTTKEARQSSKEVQMLIKAASGLKWKQIGSDGFDGCSERRVVISTSLRSITGRHLLLPRLSHEESFFGAGAANPLPAQVRRSLLILLLHGSSYSFLIVQFYPCSPRMYPQ